MPILCHIIFNAIVLIDQLKWMDNYWGINLLIKDQKVKLCKAHASKYRLKSSMGQTRDTKGNWDLDGWAVYRSTVWERCGTVATH